MADLTLDPPLALRAHHAASLANLATSFAGDPAVLALLLGGSIAHGFAAEFADIDYLVVVTADEYARRAADGRLTAASRDGITYDGGYTDGKFVDLAFLRRAAESGSEPARFAFADARFVIERDPAVRPLLAEIVRYPEAGVDERIERFAAQLHAWQWFLSEARAKDNRYLELLAVQKLVLFSCRVVLAVNRVLYPFHKWMLRVTAGTNGCPPGLMDDLDRLLAAPDAEFVDAHVRRLCAYAGVDHDRIRLGWGGHFLRDNELTWTTGSSPIDDL